MEKSKPVGFFRVSAAEVVVVLLRELVEECQNIERFLV
jgi:hypothetical protein